MFTCVSLLAREDEEEGRQGPYVVDRIWFPGGGGTSGGTRVVSVQAIRFCVYIESHE